MQQGGFSFKYLLWTDVTIPKFSIIVQNLENSIILEKSQNVIYKCPVTDIYGWSI